MIYDPASPTALYPGAVVFVGVDVRCAGVGANVMLPAAILLRTPAGLFEVCLFNSDRVFFARAEQLFTRRA